MFRLPTDTFVEAELAYRASLVRPAPVTDGGVRHRHHRVHWNLLRRKRSPVTAVAPPATSRTGPAPIQDLRVPSRIPDAAA